MALTAVTCLLCCHVGFAAAKTLPRTLTCTRCGNKSQHEAAKLIRPLSPVERRAEAQVWARYMGEPQRRERRTGQRIEARKGVYHLPLNCLFDSCGGRTL
jgi:hypothetical protein